MFKDAYIANLVQIADAVIQNLQVAKELIVGSPPEEIRITAQDGIELPLTGAITARTQIQWYDSSFPWRPVRAFIGGGQQQLELWSNYEVKMEGESVWITSRQGAPVSSILMNNQGFGNVQIQADNGNVLVWALAGGIDLDAGQSTTIKAGTGLTLEGGQSTTVKAGNAVTLDAGSKWNWITTKSSLKTEGPVYMADPPDYRSKHAMGLVGKYTLAYSTTITHDSHLGYVPYYWYQGGRQYTAVIELSHVTAVSNAIWQVDLISDQGERLARHRMGTMNGETLKITAAFEKSGNTRLRLQFYRISGTGNLQIERIGTPNGAGSDYHAQLTIFDQGTLV